VCYEDVIFIATGEDNVFYGATLVRMDK